jgi:CheY-like chemotaxis protein
LSTPLPEGLMGLGPVPLPPGSSETGHLPALPPEPGLAEAPSRLRLLYVEDNRINALLFEETIRLRTDVELMLAEDGKEALSLVQHWRPDVLVLDAHLPDMNGLQLLVALRAQAELHNVPAFMCSADASPNDIERAAHAGFTGYWTKPIDLRLLMAELDRLQADLQGRRQPR